VEIQGALGPKLLLIAQKSSKSRTSTFFVQTTNGVMRSGTWATDDYAASLRWIWIQLAGMVIREL